MSIEPWKVENNTIIRTKGEGGKIVVHLDSVLYHCLIYDAISDRIHVNGDWVEKE